MYPPPENIFNFDETNVTDDPGCKRVLVRRGTKYPTNVRNYSKSATTIMMCGSASGVLLPPYVIYKFENLYDTWTQNGLKGKPLCQEECCARGFSYNRTKSGWIDATTFSDWFQKVFLPHAKRLLGRTVLIGDNLTSHFSTEVVKACKENGIAFLCLVPNSTHLLQPLDVGFFRPFKAAWRRVVAGYKEKYPRSKGISKSIFPELLKYCLSTMDTISINKKVFTDRVKTNLFTSFKACGISPTDKNEVLKRLPDYKPSNENTGMDMSVTVIDFLKQMKTAHTSTLTRIRSRKVRVEPRKSVTSADLVSEVTQAQTTPADGGPSTTQGSSSTSQASSLASNSNNVNTNNTLPQRKRGRPKKDQATSNKAKKATNQAEIDTLCIICAEPFSNSKTKELRCN